MDWFDAIQAGLQKKEWSENDLINLYAIHLSWDKWKECSEKVIRIVKALDIANDFFIGKNWDQGGEDIIEKNIRDILQTALEKKGLTEDSVRDFINIYNLSWYRDIYPKPNGLAAFFIKSDGYKILKIIRDLDVVYDIFPEFKKKDKTIETNESKRIQELKREIERLWAIIGRQSEEIRKLQKDVSNRDKNDYTENNISERMQDEEIKCLSNYDIQTLLQQPISILELSIRANKSLFNLNIHTIADLVTRNEDELLRCQNFGRTNLVDIKEKLENLNLSLGMQLESEY